MNTFNNLPPSAKAAFAFILIVLGIAGYRILMPSTPNTATSIISQSDTKQTKTTKVGIIVRDKINEQVLPKTRVEITSDGPPIFKTTDNNGYVEVTIEERDTLEINLQKEGYKNAKFTLNLSSDPNTTKKLYLEPIQ
ncbi:hypothetical protein PN462_15405 [Spirulina sp. CS-785/01]|uniref:hypothetical protein n=1 Tax=Spirulina sp. CS-785/01 TaxID=3021716 RepID=UPI00232DEEB5|nr:hypothetical protein [Spirulina sp. CS-785/01]MDB9314498.1 hypothetical protein [Spirulina sp. CS-785/01]